MIYANSIILLSFCLYCQIILAQTANCVQGDSLLKASNFQDALKIYKSCYEQDTTQKNILAALAYCYFQTGDYAFAKPTYHTLEQDSLYKNEAISKLAIIYETQQNLPKAIKYYLVMNKIYPNNPIYLRKLANLYQQGKATTEAIQTYRRALQLNPRDLLTIQALADIHLSMNEFSIADSIVTKGISLDSSNIGLLLIKSKARYRMRDYSTTANILYQLTSQTELNNYYNKLLGYAFMQIDSLDKAIHYLQKSIVNENDPEYALYYLALAHEMKGEYDKAIWFFEEASKAGISPNMALYHKGLARIFTNLKEYKKVIAQYQKSLTYQYDPEVYFYMGNAAEQSPSNNTNALNFYQKYIDSKQPNEEWVRLAKKRIKILKEYEFMHKK